jgi:hypothetical protein
LALVLACSAGRAAQPTAEVALGVPQPSAGHGASALEPAEAGEPPPVRRRDGRFIVLGAALEVRSLEPGIAPITLAAPVEAALYDAALGLVWVQSGGGLGVIDLRAASWAEIPIARGLPPGHHLIILNERQPGATLTPESSCDPNNRLVLEWGPRPALRVDDSVRPTQVALDPRGQRWLLEHAERPVQSPPQRYHLGLAERRIPLDRAKLDCDQSEECGKALPLPPRGAGTELVLVQSRRGADCNHYACLLHDPRTGTFATPPLGPTWSDASAATRGSCGLYLFNREEAAYLVGSLVCQSGQLCVASGGAGLGWLEPGPIIGEPSIDF